MHLLGFTANFRPLCGLRPTNVNRRRICPLHSTSMKLLSHEKQDVVFSSADGDIAKYMLEIEIPGAFSKQKRKESVQAMRKHANFPGFRKGTIPPFILKDLDRFVLSDSAEEMIDEAIKQLDLTISEGENNEPQYDVGTLVKDFVVGQDFCFQCNVVLASTTKGEIDVDNLEELTLSDDDYDDDENDEAESEMDTNTTNTLKQGDETGTPAGAQS